MKLKRRHYVTVLCKKGPCARINNFHVGQKLSMTCALSILRFLYFRKELSFAYFSVQDGCSMRSQSFMQSVYFQPLITVLHYV